MERILKQFLQRKGPLKTSPQRSRAMSAVRGAGNHTTEKRLRAGLIQAGIQGWNVNPAGVLGKPDFWFPRTRVAVFVDGCFWHGCAKCGHLPKSNSGFWALKIGRTKSRDKRNSKVLRRMGVQVIRIWEHELTTGVTAVVTRLALVLSSRRTTLSA